jgi:hypothetical protein
MTSSEAGAETMQAIKDLLIKTFELTKINE